MTVLSEKFNEEHKRFHEKLLTFESEISTVKEIAEKSRTETINSIKYSIKEIYHKQRTDDLRMDKIEKEHILLNK